MARNVHLQFILRDLLIQRAKLWIAHDACTAAEPPAPFAVVNGGAKAVLDNPGLLRMVLTDVVVLRVSEERSFRVQDCHLTREVTESELQFGVVTADLSMLKELVIRVRDREGRPAASQAFGLVRVGDSSREVHTDSEGEAVLLAAPGRYLSTAGGPHASVVQFDVGSSGNERHVIDLAAG